MRLGVNSRGRRRGEEEEEGEEETVGKPGYIHTALGDMLFHLLQC